MPVVDEVLTAIWGGNADFHCTGSGGDIAMPGSEYQPLHSDSSTAPHKPVHDAAGRVIGIVLPQWYSSVQKPAHLVRGEDVHTPRKLVPHF